MTKKLNLPPRTPSYQSLLRIQRFMKNPIPFMNRNLKKYGDTYCFSLRYSKINIITIDPDIIQHFLRKNEDNYKKPVADNEVLGHFVGKGLLLATGERHAAHRKLMAPGFRPKSIDKLIGLMDEQIDRYFLEMDKRIEKNPTLIIDHEFSDLTFRVMTRAIYGDDMNQDEISAFSDRFQNLQKMMIKLVRIPRLLKFYQMTGQTKFYEQVARDNNAYLNQLIAARRKQQPKEDLLGMLLTCRYEDSDEGMSDDQLREETLTLFVAGHETAANCLSWIIYILGKHPEVIKKILAERDEIIGDQVPEFSRLLQMDYLNRVFDECLRIYPPSWITNRIAMEDDHVNGFDIPKGARVIPFIYGLHHSEKLWPDAENFDPDRFTKEGRKDRHNFAHMPFGAGPRMCIGRHFATLEMKMIILKMLQKYQFTLVEDHKVELLPSVTLKPANGIKIRFG